MAAAAGLFLIILGGVGDQGVGSQEQRADARGILQGITSHLGGVNDARLHQVGVLVLKGVVAEVGLAFGDLGNDDSAVLTGVFGDLVEGEMRRP